MTSPEERITALSLLAIGVFLLAVAAVLRWSSHRLAILRDEETDLREYFADERPWMPEQVAPAQTGLQSVNAPVSQEGL